MERKKTLDGGKLMRAKPHRFITIASLCGIRAENAASQAFSYARLRISWCSVQ